MGAGPGGDLTGHGYPRGGLEMQGIFVQHQPSFLYALLGHGFLERCVLVAQSCRQ